MASNKQLNATITIGGAVAGSLKSAFGTVNKSLQQVGSTISNLEKQNKLLANSIQTFGRQGKNVDSMRAKYAANTAAIDKLRTAQERLNRVEAARDRNMAKREAYKSGILETVALGATVVAPVKAAMDFESTMADIRKVVDFPEPDGLQKMGQTILDMSKLLPMTANDIGKIIAAGGQSGIATKELTAFAESAIKMGVAFDITADEAGQSMAEMRAAFRMTQPQVNELADKINYLGNNTAASAKDIMEIVQRIGPLGEVAGAASGSIAAMGATLRGMGVQNEIAATGIKNLLLTLSSGKAATKAQQAVFKKLGYSASQVSKSMQLNADETIRVILKKISKLNKADQAAALTQLFGKEVVGSIAPLLTNLDQLQENLKLVGDATKYAGSMEKEYQARAATTANSLVIFRNQINALGITIGSVLLPAVNSLLMTVGPWIGQVTDLAQKYPAVTKAVIATAGALVTLKVATFAAGFAFTYLRGGLLNITGVMASARAQMTLLATRGLPLIATGVRTVGAAFVSTGIGALIAGVAMGGVWIYQNWDGVKAFMVGTIQGISEGLQPLTSRFAELWNNLGPVRESLAWVGNGLKTAWEWFGKLLEPVAYTSQELKNAGDAGKSFGEALADGINFVTAPLQFLIDKLNWVLTNIDVIKNKAIEFESAVSDTVGGAWDKTKNFFSNPFGSDEDNGKPAAAAPGMKPPAPPQMANRSGNTYQDNSQNTIQVVAQPGQSGDDLAKKITAAQERQRQIRQRSMMTDGAFQP